MAVEPSKRRLGIGRQLVDALEAQARSEGIEQIYSVLLAEDERDSTFLEKSGFSVDPAYTAKEAITLGEQEDYRVSILDLGLPDGNGLDVLKKWRAKNIAFPVLILTARDDWHDKVAGLKAGADDYLAKPFQTEELIARLNAIVRRSEGRTHSLVKAGRFVLDENRQCLSVDDGTEHPLTGTEFRLLRCLMSKPGHVFSKDQLLEQLYSLEDSPSANVIEAYIRRLRRLVGNSTISTRRGQGYMFNDNV